MIDFENIRTAIASGLRDYCGCPIIKSNQNQDLHVLLGKEENERVYSYGSYTIVTPLGENGGTYGECEDGKARKQSTQNWSLTFQSDDEAESLELACKAHEWLEYVGIEFLKDRGVDIKSVGSIHNRDNFLTIEYEYRNGFDFVVWLIDEVSGIGETDRYIDAVEIDGNEMEKQAGVDELNDLLARRLDGEAIGNT